ncbi:MAG TPA: hypothetical protein PL188_02485 [Candidatus Cloacimonadota bacterium]|nr:hypothetical protein [Candidatus Cloacimonadota bacterium]
MKDELIERVQRDVADEQKHRDGIPQIAVGVFLVITSLLLMTGNGNTFVVFIPLMPILIEALRRRITYPRIGFARVIESGKRRNPTLWVVFALLVAGMVVFIMRRMNPEILPQARNPYFLMMWATAMLVILFGVIFLTKRRSKRIIWSLVAVLAILSAIVIFRLQKDLVFKVMIAFGGIQILLGAYSLYDFIKKYPVIKDDE